MNSFQPIKDSLFFTKNDPLDPRLGEIVQAKTPDQIVVNNGICIFGYPDDDGIKLNGGRIGAAVAPAKIRESLYKMTPPVADAEKFHFFEMGDLKIEGDLASRHETAKGFALELYRKQQRLVTFGGGHDYGYPDAAAFVEYHKNQGLKPVVINLDAHLDVRPTTNGFNSGTPFYRLLNDYHDDFIFVEIGIQPQCNSIFHKNWAKERGAYIFDLADLVDGKKMIDLFQAQPLQNLSTNTPVFLSFDIDALTSSEAGGCSQSWATGLNIQDYFNFFNALKKKSDLRGLGIYEVSPPLDTDNRTSKIAALVAYQFLFQDVL